MTPDDKPDFLDRTVRFEWLRKPFKPEQLGKRPQPTKKDNQKGRCSECGGWHGLPAIHLDYAGHAAVTDRLNTVTPDWYYFGDPVVEDGHVLAYFGTMVVEGIHRQEVGAVDSPSTYGQELKEAISDFIRRGAMRFGVGIDLWSKEDLTTSGSGDANSADPSDAIGGKSSDSDPDSGPVSSRGTQGAGPDTASEGEKVLRKGKPGSNSPSDDTSPPCDHDWRDTWVNVKGETLPVDPAFLCCSKCRHVEKKSKLQVTA